MITVCDNSSFFSLNWDNGKSVSFKISYIKRSKGFGIVIHICFQSIFCNVYLSCSLGCKLKMNANIVEMNGHHKVGISFQKDITF